MTPINRTTLVNEPVGTTLTMVYDNVGNRTEVQDGTGVEDSTYDARGRLTNRTYAKGGTNVVHIEESYDVLDRVTSLTRYSSGSPGAVVASTSYTYDDADRLTNLQHQTSTPSNIANYTYTYDAAWNLSTETRNSTVTTYTYDNTNQLTGATGMTSISYDADGNRTNTGYSTGTGNQITSDGTWNYSYDNEGNITSKTIPGTGETWTYTYDNRNELTKAEHKSTSGGSIDKRDTYVYDAFGNRIEKDVDADGDGAGAAVVTKFALDGWNPAKAGGTATPTGTCGPT